MSDWKNETTKQARILSSKRGLWLFPMLVFLFVIISLLMLVWPTYQQWNENKSKIEVRQADLEELTTKRTQLEKLAYQGLEGRYEVLERVLPSRKPVFEFLAAMDNEASKSGVTLGSYTLNPGLLATEAAELKTDNTSDKPGEMAIMPIEMDVTGTIDQISEFLQGLEKLAPLVGLQAMDLSLGTNKSQPDFEEERSVKIKLDLHYALHPKQKETSLLTKGFSKTDEVLFELLATYNAYESLVANDTGLIEERVNPFAY